MPTASVVSPSGDTTVAGGNDLTLQGNGEDSEDGELTGEALEWTSDVDGDLGTGQTQEVTLSSDTTHEVVLTATDSDGATDADSVDVSVGNERPVASVTSPSQDTTVAAGDGLTLQGNAEDPEDGELTDDALVWSSDVDGELGTGTSVAVKLTSDTTHQVKWF